MRYLFDSMAVPTWFGYFWSLCLGLFVLVVGGKSCHGITAQGVGSCITVKYNKEHPYDWFEAATDCGKMGGRLAWLQKSDLVNTDLITNCPRSSSCRFLWTGQLHDQSSGSTDGDTKHHAFLPNKTDSEDSHQTCRGLLRNNSTGTWSWQTHSCDEKLAGYGYICEKLTLYDNHQVQDDLPKLGGQENADHILDMSHSKRGENLTETTTVYSNVTTETTKSRQISTEYRIVINAEDREMMSDRELLLKIFVGIGSLLIMACLIVAVFYVRRSKSRDDERRKNSTSMSRSISSIELEYLEHAQQNTQSPLTKHVHKITLPHHSFNSETGSIGV